MLASVSRRITKNVVLTKRTSVAPKTRKYATNEASVPSLKLPVYEGVERKEIQEVLDKWSKDLKLKRKMITMLTWIQLKHAARVAFWKKYSTVYGVDIPKEAGVDRSVLSGVISSTTESWAEYMYALRSYQAKLQQDPAFLKTNEEAVSQDANVAKKARTSIASFIKSIPTKSEKAKSGVTLLIGDGHYLSIKSGEAAAIAQKYITKFKREIKIELTTAHKLTAQEHESWLNRFKHATTDERSKIIMTTKEDASILGGSIINVNGNVYDQSWKHQQDVVMESLAQLNSL